MAFMYPFHLPEVPERLDDKTWICFDLNSNEEDGIHLMENLVRKQVIF